jgi:tRNA(Ile)-lysidine synthase
VPTFLTRVAATIARYQMIAPGETVLVALSAGADSTALLHALVQLGDKLGCRVCACHIHHGLRGADADADAEQAGRLAESLGVGFSSARADVRTYSRERKLSLEAAAREVRYRLLEEAASSLGAHHIATGHTADDQAETVLLNLLRGAGPAGLAGIPPVRGRIIRPLLEVTREQVRAYCWAHSLPYRADQSNRDLRFTRNRIRHEILPGLRRIQPRVEDALCRLARVMREENAFVAAEATRRLEEIATQVPEGWALPAAPFAELPPGLQRRVARAAIAKAKGDELDIEFERVEALVGLLTSGHSGARIELPGGLQAFRAYGRVVIGKVAQAASAPTGVWDLPVPGEVEIAELGVAFRTSRSRARRPAHDPFLALLDTSKMNGPLQVRTWRPGDRFHPLGAPGRTKLQDFFVNAKVPRAERHRVPLVLCGGRIIWVVGHRIGDEVKVSPETRRAIRIEARPSGRM